MVDLSMPAGLDERERRAWLARTGAALIAETGQPSGVTEHQEDAEGNVVFGMWWTNEDYDGPSYSSEPPSPAEGD